MLTAMSIFASTGPRVGSRRFSPSASGSLLIAGGTVLFRIARIAAMKSSAPLPAPLVPRLARTFIAGISASFSPKTFRSAAASLASCSRPGAAVAIRST